MTPATLNRADRHLDRLGWWAVAAVVLIVIGYGPFFMSYMPSFLSPGFKLF